MKAKKRNEATPMDLVLGYRVADEDEETQEVGGIADLMHTLDKVDEHNLEAKNNAVGMKDSSGQTIKFNEGKGSNKTVK